MTCQVYHSHPSLGKLVKPALGVHTMINQALIGYMQKKKKDIAAGDAAGIDKKKDRVV